MKLRSTILLLILTFSVGCDLLIKEKAKPVEINGLGFLSQLKSKNLEYDDLVKVVKAVVKLNNVTDEDASAMLEIYKRNVSKFSSASNSSDNDRIGQSEVESYIALMLQHKDLIVEVEVITNAEAKRILSEGIDFGKESGAGSLRAGAFFGTFLNAYFKAVTKDDIKAQDEKYEANQQASELLVLGSFEQVTNEIINGKPEATSEQKAKAEQFLQDLKIYNEQLKDTEKILDTNGHLIDIQAATGDQKTVAADIVGGNSNSSMKNRAVGEAAAKRMANVMADSYQSFRQAITDNLKRQ